jgi:signal peptidase I
MKTQQEHSALVRGEDGGLHVRRFEKRADAAAAEGSREVSPALATAGKKGWSTGKVAKLIGVSQRTIIRRCEDGTIPHTDHGTVGQARRTIASETVRLIRAHGLRGLGRMRQAGLVALAVVCVVFGANQVEAKPITKDAPVTGIEIASEVPLAVRIVGSSMAPALPAGRLVRVEAVTMGEVRVGDVIVYHDWRQRGLVAHRVVRADGQWWVTKGDANSREDARLVSARNLRWRVQDAPALAAR